MNTPAKTLEPAVRAPLDAYLDAVDRVLADSGVSRSDRRNICDEVEAQALEMLRARSEGSPTEQQMRAVLAELDDPEAYGDGANSGRAISGGRSTSEPHPVPKRHPFALWAFLIPVIAVLLVFMPIGPKGEAPTLSFLGIATLLSLLVGIVAIREIRREPGQYTGIKLSLIGMLALPLIVLNLTAYLLAPEFEPFGLRESLDKAVRAKAQSQLIEREKELRQDLEERKRKLQQEGRAVLAAKLDDQIQTLNRARITVQLTPNEHWMAANMWWLLTLTRLVATGITLAFSIFLFFWLLRRCRPRIRIETGHR